MKKIKKEMQIIGWREWLTLDELDIPQIKAKVDTGARTSSLHAFDVESYTRNGKEFVKFKVHPDQDSTKNTVTCRAKILEYRKVRSSNGQSELRPVIVTNVELLGEKWPIEITLTNRDAMGFRMLLGRASIKGKFLVDTGKSYYCKALIAKDTKTKK
ncbi:MAG: hypothetical protein ACJAS4_001232 [Bacteriovoracaceae bacterium]|jgi:hypothetical protein